MAREVTLRKASDVCCGDLTLEQFQTLRALDGPAPVSLGALSTQLRVDLSTMSRNVSLLERSGYLRRARSEADGRVVLIRLLAKGRRALASLQCDERDVLADVYQRLAPSERPAVLKALEVLQACLENGANSPCCSPERPGRCAS
ncbi:MAG TPA: MarR family winged helix-turn-helix transcriptional regulator [Polyangia bacterium]|nr:MarR family winged helix-turn-helix transcriptional regulator [Polyangia bacterium]